MSRKTERLEQAIGRGVLDDVKCLLQTGYSVNLPFTEGITPLNYALLHKQEEIAHFLLDNGANVNKPDCFRYDERERTAIHYAASLGSDDVISTLVCRKGVDVNQADITGSAALHYAAEAGTLAVIKTLLQLGAKIDQQNKSGHTPLWKATRSQKCHRIFSFLLQEGASVAVQDQVGATVLFEVIRHNRTELITPLLRHGLSAHVRDVEGNTALHIASCMGRTDACDVIMRSSNADMNATNDYGNTPLHNSAIYNHTQTTLGLLNYGACANILNKCAHSPLYLAMLHKNYECTSLLHNSGARLTQKELLFYEQFEAKRCDFRAEFLAWAVPFFQTPKSLYLLTILKIRKTVGMPIDVSMATVGLPPKLCSDVISLMTSHALDREE